MNSPDGEILDVQTSVTGSGVGTLTLNRPAVLNALTPAMLKDIIGVLEAWREDKAIRVVVVTGSGRAFCSGGDVNFLASEVAGSDPLTIKGIVYPYFQGVVRALQACRQPVIAAVNGLANGAGCELALACDLRLASDSAWFREAWITHGSVPPLGGTFLLPRILGLTRAMHMVMLGDRLPAMEALRIGLVNEVVAESQLAAATAALAERLAAGPPLALAAAKEALYRGLESSLRNEWGHMANVQAMLLSSQDYREGISAEREKRNPTFSGQ